MFVYLSTLFPGNPLGPSPTGLGSPFEPLCPSIPGFPSGPFSPRGPVIPLSPLKPRKESYNFCDCVSYLIFLSALSLSGLEGGYTMGEGGVYRWMSLQFIAWPYIEHLWVWKHICGKVIAQSVGNWDEKQQVLGLSPRADTTWKVFW